MAFKANKFSKDAATEQSNCLHEDSIPTQLFLKDSLGSEWEPTQWSPAGFNSDHFLEAMLNLIRNPNITSSHLFRADLMYDSDSDAVTFTHAKTSSTPLESSARHLKAIYRPLPIKVEGFIWRRTIVRELVPRNRTIDSPMVQSCHIFERHVNDIPRTVTTLVIYLPHIGCADEMPFYHPNVRGICFAHVVSGVSDPGTTAPFGTLNSHEESYSLITTPGGLSVYLRPFPTTPISSLEPKMSRITLRLLQTAHKLAQGVKDGYQKRVHHDLIVPQRCFQETYARLKECHARSIVDDWREQTDPTKHVFEDLAITAFLIELWRGMYGIAPISERDPSAEPESFPGFVDIGCGNGLLVHLLLTEGYPGWGFDVRSRKTWSMFPPSTQSRLLTRTLVPSILLDDISQLDRERFHPGTFDKGTFIISNHADELTPWTPLLASLNESPFIAIPCCSHDLGGARFRAPKNLKSSIRDTPTVVPPDPPSCPEPDSAIRETQAAETGSLRRSTDSKGGKTQPSAYAALCAYVVLLAKEVGYEPETEMLRIPSTRNACIVGRAVSRPENEDQHGREDVVRRVVEEEMGMDLAEVRRAWMLRAESIAGKQGGH